MSIKAIAAFGIVGGLVVGVPLVVGMRIESGVRAAVAEAPAYSPYPVSLLRYDRGLFSATAETRHLITLESDAGPNLDAEGNFVEPPKRQLWATVHHAISHGPRLDGLRLARIVNTVRFDGELGTRLASLFGAAEPLTVTVDVGLAGGHAGTVLSPAVEQADAGLNWAGLDGRFRLDGERLTGQFESPGLRLTDGSLAIGPLQASADLVTVAGSVWTGRFDSRIESIAGQGPGGSMALNGLTVASTTTEQDGSLRTTVTVGFDALGSDDLKVNQGRFEVVVDSLPTQAMSDLNRALNRQAAASAAGTSGDDANMAVRSALSALAAGQPQLSLERLSFVDAKHGKFELRGRARYIGDAELADFSPMTDVEGSARFDAAMPLIEALVARQAGDAARASPTPPTPEQLAAQVQGILGGLVAQGLLVVEDGRGRSELAFKAGVLTVNGKPMGAPPI